MDANAACGEREQPQQVGETGLKRPLMDDDAENSENKQRRMADEDMDIEDEEPRTTGASSSGETRNMVDALEMKILAKVLMGVDLTEVYSPERIARVCMKYNLKAGSSMDLLTGYDFTKPEDRRRAWEKIKREEPMLVVGSPPCTLFSALQELNKSINKDKAGWMDDFNKRLEEAKEHVRFCCAIYRHQLRMGRHFLHEHPWMAKSWELDCIKNLLEDERVLMTRTDMCRFGMRTTFAKPEEGTGPAKKPTGFMGSSWCIADELARQCEGGHKHAPLMGGERTSKAAIYPKALCEAIARGLMKQKKFEQDGIRTSKAMNKNQISSMMKGMCKGDGKAYTAFKEAVEKFSAPGKWNEKWTDTGHEQVPGHSEIMHIVKREGGKNIAYDDITGTELNADMVKNAREEEMTFFKKMGVYDVVDESHMHATGGKLIDLKWIDTNKGDSKNPEIRSRLVGREFNVMKDDSLYAATPPLEAMRLVLSDAATQGELGDKEVMINDVRRAYFYARTERDVYVRLPDEDPAKADGKIGKLNLCLYGTRDAAKAWQEELSKHLLSIGFERGIGFPSVFAHRVRGIKLLVHGDDYFSSGRAADLDWLQQELEKKYELKTQRVGRGKHKLREGKVLNRVVRLTESGWEMEADPRHAELVVEQLGLENEKGLSTPGSDNKDDEDNEDDKLLDEDAAKKYRMIAARCNYLSLDRPDFQFAVKEACREMSSPTTGSLRRLVRMGRYLRAHPRVVWEYAFQAQPEALDIYTDADWAGCRRTRKSTSGGAVMNGSHCIKTWAKTQAVIAKSSAESELYAVVRGGCEGLGMMTLTGELGEKMKVRMHIDSSAAKGILERQGLHKIRHLDVDMLWMQSQAAKEVLEVLKVKGDYNLADLLTKHLGKATMLDHMHGLGVQHREGRAGAAAQLHLLREPADEGRGADSWGQRGQKGTWTRIHATPRRSLFTPFKVAKGPPSTTKLAYTRITTGRFDDGREFHLADAWLDDAARHRLLQRPWTGKTTFFESNPYV